MMLQLPSLTVRLVVMMVWRRGLMTATHLLADNNARHRRTVKPKNTTALRRTQNECMALGHLEGTTGDHDRSGIEQLGSSSEKGEMRGRFLRVFFVVCLYMIAITRFHE